MELMDYEAIINNITPDELKQYNYLVVSNVDLGEYVLCIDLKAAKKNFKILSSIDEGKAAIIDVNTKTIVKVN